MKFTSIKNYFLIIFAIAVLAMTGCRSNPVANYQSQTVPSNIQSASQVKDAIRSAGASLGWIIAESNDSNKLQGTLNIRKHQAVISIPYSKENYSLMYQSSINLDHDESNNSIHNNYNGWLVNLNNAIQLQLSLVK